MLLRLPTSVPEAQECLAEGAVPIGGATLVWASWQRDGFPEQAVSLRDLPEANVIGREVLGAAVLLSQVDERVPEALRGAAASVGTGAVRRAATVGGNLVGSSLRCLLPPALVLDARCTVLAPHQSFESDLAEVVAKRHVLLSLRWREPLTSSYRKMPADAGGPPPLTVAAAVHADKDGSRLLRVAVRDGYEVFGGATVCKDDTGRLLRQLADTELGSLDAPALEIVREQVTELIARPEAR